LDEREEQGAPRHFDGTGRQLLQAPLPDGERSLNRLFDLHAIAACHPDSV
jgi:hypothetical protein